MIKKLLFCAIVVSAFLVGYGQVAQAIMGRSPGQGYFFGASDTAGDYVFRSSWSPGPVSSGCEPDGSRAIPMWVSTKQLFISYILCKLNSNATYHVQREDRTGAAFVIQTMRGVHGPWACEGGAANNCRPSDASINDWAARINNPAVSVNFNACVSWSTNSLYQGNPVVGNSSPNDNTFYTSSGSSCEAIQFTWPGGSYQIRRLCGNPVASGEIPPIPLPWQAAGYTMISDSNDTDVLGNITTRAGEALTFKHRIRNDGPGNSANIWYQVDARYGGSTNQWAAQYYNNTALSGSPVLTRNEYIIDYRDSVGNVSPGPGVNADGFSARWTKVESFPAGNTTFTMKSDDGARLYVDGALVLNSWVSQGVTPFSITMNLTAGNHTIVLEYFEGGGPGWATLDYNNVPVTGGTDSGTYTVGQVKNFDRTYNVPPGAQPGTQYCQRILWDYKNSWGGGDWGTWGNHQAWGDMVCATVVADYVLTPTVVPNVSQAQAGDVARFDYYVQNTGAQSPSATCTARDQSNAVVTVPGMTCASGQVFGPSMPTPLLVGTENYTIPLNATPGTTVCRTLTIAPSTPSVASATSPQRCVVVAKTPSVRFGGSDVWAGGGFAAVTPACNTSAKIKTVGKAIPNTAPIEYAGSSVEYQAFALNQITGFGSGGRVLVDAGSLGDIARGLTYGNAESDGTKLGFFGAAQHCIDDYASLYGSLTPGVPPAITDNVSGAWRYVGAVQFTLNNVTAQMPLGSRKVYFIQGDVILGGNIEYPASYPTANDTPGLIIIATGDIRVGPAVTRLDGHFISRGTFYTCYPKTEPATTATCNNPLTVNGSVAANRIDLFRTRGADGVTAASRKEPAEFFNFSPELYWGSPLNVNSQTTIDVVNSIELPPRF